MVDIGNRSRIQSKEINAQLARMEMQEALRHGNIYEVFAKSKTFKIGDFLDFFGSQHRTYMEQIVQPNEIKVADAMYHEPPAAQFPVHHREAALTREDSQFLRQSFESSAFKAAKFKAAEGAGAAKKTDDGPLKKDELGDMAQGTLDDWQAFQDNAWAKILDMQMMSDYKAKTGEVEKEVQRIIALAKQGLVGPEFVLIAMAKITATRNGVLMTWLGKKAFKINESLSNIANDLKKPGVGAGDFQVATNKSREGGMQMQLLMTDMQKVMQDTASVIEQVQSFIGEWSRTKREIITKVAAN